MKREVERREILDDRDLDRLARLLAEEPELATSRMERWCDHPKGASPLGYTRVVPPEPARRGTVERLRRGRRDPRTDYVVVTEGLVGWAARADGPSGTLQVA